MNIDPSAVSKSNSDVINTENNKLLIMGKSSMIDIIFPLYDQITQQVRLPYLLHFFVFLWYCLQVTVLSIWPVRNAILKDQVSVFNSYIESFAYFAPSAVTKDSIMVQIVIFSCIFVVCLGFLIFQLVYFSNYRKLVKWTLMPSRFLLEAVSLLMLHPVANLFGKSFKIFYENGYQMDNVIYMGCCAIYYLFFSLMYSASCSLTSSSAYMQNSYISSFHSSFILFFAIGNPAFRAFHYVFIVYEEWADLIVIFVHISLFIYYLNKCKVFPYALSFSNITFFGVVVASIILDFARVVVFFSKSIGHNTFTFIFIGSVVFGMIFSNFYYNFVIERTRKDLSYNREQNLVDYEDEDKEDLVLTDEEKSERFRSLQLDCDGNKAIAYLHYGQEYMTDLFIDFSVVKYIIQNQPSTEVLIHCIRSLSFFPTEYRLLNLLTNAALRRRDLKQRDRFLVFQVHRIKILRQSSSSSAAAEKLAEMRQITKQCETETRSYWNKSEANIDALVCLSDNLSRARSLWVETLNDYPNSSAHHEEYAHFMIECATDFETAVRMKHKASLIESGANFSTDYCFRSMVRCYPNYLKKKVLDVKGNLMKSKNKNKGSQTHSSGPNSFNTSNGFDARLEEEIGKTMVQQAKMRLALQRATMERKANNSNRLSTANYFVLFFNIALLTFIYFYLQSYFDGRYHDQERVTLASRCLFDFSFASFLNLLHWASDVTPPRLNITKYNDEFYTVESSSNSFISQGSSYQNISMEYGIKSRKDYLEFLQSISTLASSGVNIFSLTTVLLVKSTPLTWCSGGAPLEPRLAELKSVFVYESMAQSLLVAMPDYENWWINNSYFCSLYSTHFDFSSHFEDMLHGLALSEHEEAEHVESNLMQLFYFVPSSYIIISISLIIVVSYLFIKETNTFVTLMLSIDEQHKHLASQALRRDSEESSEISRQMHGTFDSNSILCHILMLLFTIVLICGLICFSLYEAIHMNDQYFITSQWSYLAGIRSSLVVDCLIALTQSVFLYDPVISTTNVTNISFSLQKLEESLELLEVKKEELLMGNQIVEALVGHDTLIDTLSMTEQCKPPTVDATLHDMYRCGSTNQLLAVFKDFIMESKAEVNQYNATLQHEIFINLIHLCTDHLLPLLKKIDERFVEVIGDYVSVYSYTDTILYIAGLILSCILFWIVYDFLQLLDIAYEMGLILLRRVPPIGIISKSELVEYLMNKSNEKQANELTTTSSIIHNSADGVLCLGLSGIIESVNPSISHILGYTPEQLLGQPISTLFSTEDGEKLRNQLQLIEHKQSASTYEDHMKCVSDSDLVIPCNIIVLGMADESSKIESFVIIIRDESSLLKQQEEAEEAKKQSESLLFQILPRDIVVRLNQGEKDISFVVHSASIMFIDIVKFSEYSAALTPQEIMGNLSMLFSAFDEALAKYNLLTKIKLIGDVYMCAAGLFTPNEPPSHHAEQIIKFGLDALLQLEEINIKLNANLNVRIGVNTGGPLIAGVLGTDKPVFDIIGDPINVASRLQSTDVPGRIQISQDTYDLISTMDFSIEPRGEIFLKGKGKSQAYLVRPPHSFAFQLSSQDLINTNSTHDIDSN